MLSHYRIDETLTLPSLQTARKGRMWTCIINSFIQTISQQNSLLSKKLFRFSSLRHGLSSISPMPPYTSLKYSNPTHFSLSAEELYQNILRTISLVITTTSFEPKDQKLFFLWLPASAYFPYPSLTINIFRSFPLTELSSSHHESSSRQNGRRSLCRCLVINNGRQDAVFRKQKTNFLASDDEN